MNVLYFILVFFIFTACILALTKIASKAFYSWFFRLFISFLISLTFFYFFETPLLWEAAFAEELSNSSETSDKAEVEKKEEVSVLQKIGFTLWSYKWTILTISLLIPVFYIFFTFTGDGNASAEVGKIGAIHSSYAPNIQERLLAFTEWSEFPSDVKFFEDIPSFKNTFLHSPDDFPAKITAGPQIYSDANLQNVVAMCSEVRNPATGNHIGAPYMVYAAKPILHAEAINPVFSDQSILTAGRVIVPYNTVIAQSLQNVTHNIPELASNPWGYSNDPALQSLIKKGIDEFGLLELHFAEEPKIELQLCYQKVVLIDPHTLHYSYYHQFSIRPTNIEAMSTPLQTDFPGKMLKAFYLKDTEFSVWENSYSVTHPDDLPGAIPKEVAGFRVEEVK